MTDFGLFSPTIYHFAALDIALIHNDGGREGDQDAVEQFRSRDAIQIMPLAAMGLVVMLLGVLLWLLHRSEVEDERRSLIQDILWVEQNLHFNLESDGERLGQLAELVSRG